MTTRRTPDFSETLSAAAIAGFVLLAFGFGVLNLVGALA